MKKQTLLSILFCALISYGHAIEKNIEEFLESRPCYQETLSDTGFELDAYFKPSEYSAYLVDTTYFCERKNGFVVVLVKEDRIVGFRLLVSKLDYLSDQETDSVIKEVYEAEGFGLVAHGSMGVNRKHFHSYTFIDQEAYGKAKQQVIGELRNDLKP